MSLTKSILSVDLGSTKTIVAIIDQSNDELIIRKITKYENKLFNSILQILDDFKLRVDRLPTIASLGIAGPVHGDTATITNSGWFIEKSEIIKRYQFETVRLINDTIAHSYFGFVGNRGDEFILTVSIGTGLGVSIGNPYQNVSIATETGHSTYFGYTDKDIEVAKFIHDSFKQIPVREFLCSSFGIRYIYEYLKTKQLLDLDYITEVEKSGNISHTVIDKILEDTENKNNQVMIEYVQYCFSGVLKDLALSYLPSHKIILCGSISILLAKLFLDKKFTKIFSAHKHMSKYLSQLRISVMDNKNSGVLGAANYGFQDHLRA